MRIKHFLRFLSVKLSENADYAENCSKYVWYPREVLFQIWKSFVNVCHCQTQYCGAEWARKKKNKKKKNQKKKTSAKTIRHLVGMPNYHLSKAASTVRNIYSSTSLIGTPLLVNNSVLIREVSFGEREYMYQKLSQYFLPRFGCPF